RRRGRSDSSRPASSSRTRSRTGPTPRCGRWPRRPSTRSGRASPAEPGPAAAGVTVLFETERLCARLPASEEADAVARFYFANRDHLQPWSPTFHHGTFSAEFWADETERRQLDFEAGREARAFLYRREDHGRVLGNLSLAPIVRGALQAA